MRTVKCDVCKQFIIPWEDFPESLHAVATCSNGVQSYENPSTHSIVEVKLWRRTIKENTHPSIATRQMGDYTVDWILGIDPKEIEK